MTECIGTRTCSGDIVTVGIDEAFAYDDDTIFLLLKDVLHIRDEFFS